MTVKRYLHIEQDVNNALKIDVFTSDIDAIAYSKKRCAEAVKELLGDDFPIPPDHIDGEEYMRATVLKCPEYRKLLLITRFSC